MTAPKGQVLGTGTRIPYVFSPDWPGVYTGHNALCDCTWGYRPRKLESVPGDAPGTQAGPRLKAEVKRLNRACVIHGGHRNA